MKKIHSQVASALLVGISAFMFGCSGGGGSSASDGGGTLIATSSSSTLVGGTTGTGTSVSSSSTFLAGTAALPTATTDSVAKLVVDKNADGILDNSDLKYTAPVMSDGSFSFGVVAVDDANQTLAQLTVEKDGFAPVVKTLYLTKNTPVTVFAKIDSKPLLTEVVTLPTTVAGRAGTFLKFGITQSDTGISTFSKLMTLSELQAEADVGLGEGTLSSATIPTSAFELNVTSVQAKMQAFDSTKAEDIALFPGAFSGHGKPTIGTTATTSTTENALESAAFDMIKLSDQNGDDVVLQSVAVSKLSTLDASSCSGMYWQRRVSSDQSAVIEAWGDDDNDLTNGFQVPIWSNDNSTGSWEFVGEGDWNLSTQTFAACVDTKWQGYLNCDSEISVGVAPKQVCFSALDQSGAAIGGVSVTAKKGGSYSSGYLNSNGTGSVSIASGVPADWSFSYSGSLTGWSSVGIDSSTITGPSTVAGCDYDANITIDNPYSATIYVYALDDKNASVSSAYVTLGSSSYNDYYSKGAYTNAQGYAEFKVKPSVAYVASYKAGTSNVNVNASVIAPETADSGKYASVTVADANVAPTSYIYTDKNTISDQANSLKFTLSASDKNGDALKVNYIKLNGTSLVENSDYTVSYKSSYGGSLYINATLDLNSSTVKNISAITPTALSQGDYTLSAQVSDTKLTATASTSFVVAANHAPTIGSIYLYSTSGGYYYENSTIPVGDYTVSAYAYDIDGDAISKTIMVDNAVVASSVTLSSGEHNISVTATETASTALSTTKTISVYVGNHKPVLNSVAASSYLIDINNNEKFRLIAYATDAESDTLTVTATDDANNSYTLTKQYTYSSKYVSADITLTAAKASNNFTIVANDGTDNSTPATVSVESIAANQAPIFTKELSSQTVNVNTSKTFECVANDPEGTLISYSWKLNGTDVSGSETTFTKTFTTVGNNTLSCTATDGDGKLSTSTASILVVDPTVTGTLSVHATYEGLKVTKHDLNTYAVVEEKITDANGDASFSVVGDRVTFAITSWPGMEVHANMLKDLFAQKLISSVEQVCYSADAPAECATADYCTLIAADTIPVWVWDAAASIDPTLPAATLVDANKDGFISTTELYNAALVAIDANHDGKLSFSEIGYTDKNVNMEMYANVPVRDYKIMFSPLGDYEQQQMYSQCSSINFDSNVTIDFTGDTNPPSSVDAFASGSGYGYGYATAVDSNLHASMLVHTYQADTDGTFDYLITARENGIVEPYYYYLLSGKTKDQMLAGVTVSAANFMQADKNVTMLNQQANVYASIATSYKGLSISTLDSYNNLYFTNPAFTYYLNIDDYTQTNIHKMAYNYYPETSLKDSYDLNNYPLLGVDIAVDKNGLWSLSGSEMNKVNSVDYTYSASAYDSNTSAYNRLLFNISWTIAPSQMPDIVLANIVPADVKADVESILGLSGLYSSTSLNVTEHKGLTETALIDLFQNDGDFSLIGERIVSYEYYDQTTTVFSSLTENSGTSNHNIESIFTIDYDVSKVFSK